MGRLSSGSERTVPALQLASWTVFAGHLLVLLAAVTGSVAPSTAIAAGGACAILAVAVLLAAAPADVGGQRAVTALIAGHGVAAVVLVLGLAPGVPRTAPLAGLGAAAALGLACLVVVRRASRDLRSPRPLTMAPRVAAILLVLQALALRWAASVSGVSVSLRAAIVLAIATLGVALLASLSVICLRVRSRWAIAGLLAWTAGWVAITAELLSLVLVSLGRPLPVALHPLPPLDAALVPIVAKAGAVAIGAVLVTSIRDTRVRHSAVVLLVGCAIFGVLAAVAEHRIALAQDFPSITALRSDRDRADAITAVALAGILWLYWRRGAGSAGLHAMRR